MKKLDLHIIRVEDAKVESITLITSDKDTTIKPRFL